jgi:hypothetical protein
MSRTRAVITRRLDCYMAVITRPDGNRRMASALTLEGGNLVTPGLELKLGPASFAAVSALKVGESCEIEGKG